MSEEAQEQLITPTPEGSLVCGEVEVEPTPTSTCSMLDFSAPGGQGGNGIPSHPSGLLSNTEGSIAQLSIETDSPSIPREATLVVFQEPPLDSPTNRGPKREAAKIPEHARCDFCQKVGAVCSYCHFRWRNMQQQSKDNLHKSFLSVLNAGEKWHVMATTIAITNNENLVKYFADCKAIDLDVLEYFRPVSNDTTSLLEKDVVYHTTLLHICCAYNRPQMAKAILEAGAVIRRDNRGNIASAYIKSEYAASWKPIWDNSPLYQRHLKIEDTRNLRKEKGKRDEVLKIYDGLIAEYPNYEYAWLAKAKFFIESRDFVAGWAWIDLLERNKSNIKWFDLDPSQINKVRQECQQQYHTYIHASEETYMKSQRAGWRPWHGCTVLDGVVVRLRRLPFPLVRRLLEYCDCETLYYASRALPKCNLWTKACEVPPPRIDSSLVRVLFAPSDTKATALHAKLVQNFQTEIGMGQMTGKAHITIEAVADCFRAYIIKVSVKVNVGPINNSYGINNRQASQSQLTRTQTLYSYSKQFNIFREKDEDDWFLSPAGEWELFE